MGLDTDLYDFDDWHDGKYDTHAEVIKNFLEGSGLSIEDIEELKRKNDPDNKTSKWKLGSQHYLIYEDVEDKFDFYVPDEDQKPELTAMVEKIISIRQESELPEKEVVSEKNKNSKNS